MKTRICPNCEEVFTPSPSYRHVICRRCRYYIYSKDHYKEWLKKPEVRERINKNVRDRKRKKYEFINEYKAERGCRDCGTKDSRVLEFDHINDNKEGQVSTLIGINANMEKVMAEAEKCEIRCANCHRIRHFEEKKNKRASLE